MSVRVTRSCFALFTVKGHLLFFFFVLMNKAPFFFSSVSQSDTLSELLSFFFLPLQYMRFFFFLLLFFFLLSCFFGRSTRDQCAMFYCQRAFFLKVCCKTQCWNLSYKNIYIYIYTSELPWKRSFFESVLEWLISFFPQYSSVWQLLIIQRRLSGNKKWTYIYIYIYI